MYCGFKLQYIFFNNFFKHFFFKLVVLFFHILFIFIKRLQRKGINMNSKFLTPLILGCALGMGALSFVACGEDSTSAPIISQTSSSSLFVPMSWDEHTPTAIKFSNLGISGTTASKIRFRGSITLDLSDSNTVEDIDAAHFTDIRFDIVNKNGTSGGVASFQGQLDLNYSTINLQELGLFTNLDSVYTECGEYTLYITAKANDGIIESVGVGTIDFVRPEEKCKIPESSSSEAKVPGAPLDTITINVNTKIHNCVDLATGKASEATTGDMCFKTFGTSGNVAVTSTTGLLFAAFDNESDGDRTTNYSKAWLPENPTTDSFTYLEPALKESIPNFLDVVDLFYVGIGPKYVRNTGSATDFYAFIVTDVSAADANGDVSFTLLVYKAK